MQTIPADITNSLPSWNVLKTALCTTIVNRLHSGSWDGSAWSVQGRNNPLGDWFKKECFKSLQHGGLCLALNSIQDSIVLFNGLSGHFTAIPKGGKSLGLDSSVRMLGCTSISIFRRRKEC